MKSSTIVSFTSAVGISFFTFMSISYLIDVYKKQVFVEKNPIKYALYLTFFPHILQGPITKSKDFLPQVDCTWEYNEIKILGALYQIGFGIIQKAIVADSIGTVISPMFSDVNAYSGFQFFIAVPMYAVQIYFDFAGYSDIAIGTAKLFGYNLSKNFDHPYFSKSVAEFWRRWHITLGAWLREYVYFPLGGSRKGPIRKYVNLLIVFLISGLWHGASWNYVFWGFLHALFQIFSSITRNLRMQMKKILRIKENSNSLKVLQISTVFLTVSFAWVFFRAHNMNDAFNIIKKIIKLDGFDIIIQGFKETIKVIIPLFGNKIVLLRVGLTVTTVSIISIASRSISLKRFRESTPSLLRYLLTGIMLFIIFFVLIQGPSSTESQFIYFDF